jgi:flagellar motor protein MotB
MAVMTKKELVKGQAERAEQELDDLLDELDTLLKSPDLGALLTARGINTSLALLVADALRAYLHGNKKEAAEDLSTAAEEIAARLAQSTLPTSKLSS